jgi:hypothetical protein
MPVYMVVITKKPNVQEQERGVAEVLVHGPDTVIAANEAGAISQATANAVAKATAVDAATLAALTAKLASPQIHIEVRPFQTA